MNRLYKCRRCGQEWQREALRGGEMCECPGRDGSGDWCRGYCDEFNPEQRRNNELTTLRARIAELTTELADTHADMKVLRALLSSVTKESDEAKAEVARLRGEIEKARTAFRVMANMPEYDQDDAHRLRNMAKDALELLTAAPVATDAWMPISEAPKDGSHIVVSDGTYVHESHWGGAQWCVPNTIRDWWIDPILWRPLPPPPAQEGGEA